MATAQITQHPRLDVRAAFDAIATKDDAERFISDQLELLGLLLGERAEKELSEFGANLSRLARRAAKAEQAEQRDLEPRLRDGMRVISAALAQIDHQRDVRELQPTVRDRVLDLLQRSDGPLRTSEIVDRVDANPQQVSRALKQLENAMTVINVPPVMTTDKRASAWQLVA